MWLKTLIAQLFLSFELNFSLRTLGFWTTKFRPCPHVSVFILKCNFFSPFRKKFTSTHSVSASFWPVHTYAMNRFENDNLSSCTCLTHTCSPWLPIKYRIECLYGQVPLWTSNFVGTSQHTMPTYIYWPSLSIGSSQTVEQSSGRDQKHSEPYIF